MYATTRLGPETTTQSEESQGQRLHPHGSTYLSCNDRLTELENRGVVARGEGIRKEMSRIIKGQHEGLLW